MKLFWYGLIIPCSLLSSASVALAESFPELSPSKNQEFSLLVQESLEKLPTFSIAGKPVRQGGNAADLALPDSTPPPAELNPQATPPSTPLPEEAKGPQPEEKSEEASDGTQEKANASQPQETDCDRLPESFDFLAETETPKPAETTPENPKDRVIHLESAPEKPEKSPKTDSPQKLQLTPAEIAQKQELAKADYFYRCGETALAENLYREVKTPFPAELELDRQLVPEPIYAAEQLPPAGAVYWRLYQEGLAKEIYESKRLTALQLLTEKYPEFIPGQLQYVELLQESNRPQEAEKVLLKAVTLYPQEAPLAAAKIAADRAAGRWLEAALTASQFALFNPDHFRSQEFQELAEENLSRYQGDLRSQLTWNAIGNGVVGGVGYALTGNIFGPLSALETSMMLLQGESAIGDRFSEQIKQELPLLQDREVLAYVREIGHKLAAVAGRKEFNYDFYVILDEQLNAFALPGGKIFVNAGAILKTNSEAELAGLLAHELAHAVLSHGFQQLAKGALTVNVVQYIPFVGRMTGDLLVLNYSRDMERQADVFGTRLLAASGYAADGVRNLMAVMAGENNPSPPAWLSTHPETNERSRYLEQLIVKNHLNRYAYEGVARHHKIQQRVAQLWQEYQASQAD